MVGKLDPVFRSFNGNEVAVRKSAALIPNPAGNSNQAVSFEVRKMYEYAAVLFRVAKREDFMGSGRRFYGYDVSLRFVNAQE